MSQNYTPEFKKKMVRLHEEKGRTYKSITAEYGVSKASTSKWCSEFSKECQAKAQANPDTPNEMEVMKEKLRLRNVGKLGPQHMMLAISILKKYRSFYRGKSTLHRTRE